MVLMVVDHVRHFFTNVPFPPENMEKTWLALFLTRWITHFCAPVFFLLAGMGAAIAAERRTAGEQFRYLASRGIVLVLFELTLIGFAWRFTPGYSFAGVIWCLGWSMVWLAIVARLPRSLLLAAALIIIATHDLLGRIENPSPLLQFLFRGGWTGSYFVLYPLIPWFAVMLLGYSLAPLRANRRALVTIGIAATIAFVVLRVFNIYGNPQPFVAGAKTLISLLNTAKYPPSLQYLLMTLGPALIVLGTIRGRGPLLTFGRVPFFFYLLHLYLIHLLALVIAMATGQPHDWLGFRPPDAPTPDGYGYGLPIVWLLSAIVVLLLYPPCRWFERVKATRRRRWLSYV